MFGESDGRDIKTIVRVVFHERRLQYMEKEQIDFWRQTRPGERIIDIDIPLSYGIDNIKVEPHKLNSVEFTWNTSSPSGVFFKVHCISTEFTPKKHGGEKGVPFRVQVESYLEEDGDSKLVHCASCQVKIFKPKGADRKHKTDREKMEKRSESEKEKYQPAYDCTVLTEIAPEQVHGYLHQVKQQEKDYLLEIKKERKSCKNVLFSSHQLSPPAPQISVQSLTTGLRNFQCFAESSSGSEKPVPLKQQVYEEEPPPPEIQPLSHNATAQEVTSWLQTHRFNSYVKVFQHFSGVDLLRLTRDDLIQICGLADGIRLNNALQSKAVRPKLTVYVCQRSASASLATRRQSSLTDLQKSLQNTHVSNGNSRGPSPGHSKTSASSPIAVASSPPSNTVPLSALLSPTGTTAADAVHISHPLSRSPSGSVNAAEVLSRSPPVQTGIHHHNPNTEHSHRVNAGGGDGPRRYVPMATTKRQHRDEDDNSCDAPFSSAKKQRTRNLELPRKDVYHAIYLETLSKREVMTKMAILFCIQSKQISEAYIQQKSSSFLVLLTDEVIQNMADESQYSIEGQQVSDEIPDKYRLVLRAIDS